MNVDLANHLSNCRCCFNPLKAKRKGIKLHKRFQENFLKCVGIELEESPCFSSIVCDSCKNKIDSMVTSCEIFLRNQKMLYEYVKGKSEVLVTPLNLKQEFDYEEATIDPFEVIETNLLNVSVKVENFVDESCVVEEKFSPIKVDEDYNSSFSLKPCFVNLERIPSIDNDKTSSQEIKFSDCLNEETDELLKEVEGSTKKIVCRKCGAVSDNKLQYQNHLEEHRLGRERGTDDYSENIHKPCPFCQLMLKPESRMKHFLMHQNEINNINLTCDHCDYKTRNKRNFYIHMRKHLSLQEQLKFKCRFCPDMFKSEHLQRSHEYKTHPTKAPKPKQVLYNCDCGKSFQTPAGLYYHRQTKHEFLEFPCETCGASFRSKPQLSKHFERMHKERCACEICGVLTPNISFHMRNYHSHFKCDFEGCGKEFTKRSKYDSHKQTKHKIVATVKKEEEPYEDDENGLKVLCKKCGAVMNGQRQFLDHMKLHREGREKGVDDFNEEIPKPCPFCGKMLLPESRIKHYKRHENEINNLYFMCDHCEYRSTMKRNFEYHMQSHICLGERRTIKCRFCAERFIKVGTRKLHETKMHPHLVPKPKIREYKCEFCDKVYNNQPSLFTHRKTKHLQGEFPCKDCGKVLETTSKLRTHWNIFHKPKEPCEICGVMTRRMWQHKTNYHYNAVCQVEGCGKEFTSKSMYSFHMAHRHTKMDVTVDCEHCGKTFDNKIKMDRHVLLSHTKHIICRVPDCGYRTARRSYIVTHYRNHKGIDEAVKEKFLAELDQQTKTKKRKAAD